jgi:hypothetical protein
MLTSIQSSLNGKKVVPDCEGGGDVKLQQFLPQLQEREG